MGNISTSQKADLMKLMNEAVQLLRPLTTDDTDFRDMMANVTNFRKVLSQVKTGTVVKAFFHIVLPIFLRLHVTISVFALAIHLFSINHYCL